MGPRPAADKNPKRSWKGHGFNMIWKPNFGGEFGPQDFFLQLNLTDEELEFTEITGTGIANRSLFEHTVVLGGAGYTQAINDSFDGAGHISSRASGPMCRRSPIRRSPPPWCGSGSIPHGTTINLQGVAFEVEQPRFDLQASPSSSAARTTSKTGLTPFPEEDLTKPSASRTN